MVAATQNASSSRTLDAIVIGMLTRRGAALPPGRPSLASLVEQGHVAAETVDAVVAEVGASVLVCNACTAVYTGLNPVDGKTYRCRKCAAHIVFPTELNLEARALKYERTEETIPAIVEKTPEPPAPPAPTPAPQPAVQEAVARLRESRRAPRRSGAGRFFAFDSMVLPQIIKIFFVLGMVGLILAGLAAPFVAAFSGPSFSFGNLVVGAIGSLIGTCLAILVWRMLCEWSILPFKLHEDLIQIRDQRA
jgi:hypothetical protein